MYVYTVRNLSKGGGTRENANCIISIRTCNGLLRARGHHKGIRLSLRTYVRESLR